MSSDFDPVFADETLMHSPPREDTDDTIARLYFGPQQSPEKRLIKNLLRQDDDTPRRRSARLAAPVPIPSPSPIPPYVAQQHVNTDQLETYDSGRETPDNNQDIQDEPSSALADRIIRAHDNPSPPPNNEDVPVEEPESISPKLQQFKHLPLSPEVPNSSSAPTAVTTEFPVEAVVAEEMAANSITTSDLIDFDSAALDTPTEPAAVGVDNLIPSSATPQNDSPSHEVPIPNIGKVVAGHNTLNEEGTATPFATETIASNQIPEQSPHVLPPHLTSEVQPSPLRRSKRHSSSPARTAPGAPNGFSTPIKPILPLRLPTSSKINKIKTITGESPPVAVPEDGSNIAENDERSPRKRKRQDGNPRNTLGRLSSLSPSSSSVLQQLVPQAGPESEPGPSNSRAVPFGLPPLAHPQTAGISTPSKARDNVAESHRTPLRRVAIGISPGKPGTRNFGGALFKTQSLDDPNRSPARRVLVKDVKSSPLKSVVFSRERSESAEPRPTFKGRSASAEPVFSRPPGSSSRIGGNGVGQLPFPLISQRNAIPEEDEHALPSPVKPRAMSAPPVDLITPVKSNLKQPTPSSRIPRIGAKPYTRPQGSEKSKLPVPASRIRPSTSSVKSLTTPGSGSGNSSDDGRSLPKQVTLLKRKREAESKPPVLNPQPQIIAMRQAPGIRAHERIPKLAPTAASDEQLPTPSSDDHEHPPMSSTITSVASPDPKTKIASGVPQPVDNLAQASTRTRTQDPGVSKDSTVRRTSRSRKATAADADVFTSTPSVLPASRPAPVRTRKPVEPGYLGLSALALKTLTTNNTVRNQQVVNMLETELVVKEGKRPESPTTKLRTISERQQAEKSQQRQERAERRARKVELGEIAESDMDLSFMSDIPRDDEGQPLKHRRGPGDDEDYETPERPARPSKRSKVDTDDQGEEEGIRKTVQWDRGLFTAVYLDELPDNRAWPKHVSTKKSCLAKAAKSTRLDSLGNVQNAELPVTQVVTERVIVKRFVYEGDGPPEPGPEPDSDVDAEYTPEVKPLRVKSKGRKAKS